MGVLEALHESERRLGLALDSARMGMWEWDVRSNQSVWNAKEYELLGLPVGEGQVPTDAFFRCIHPEDLTALKESLAAVLRDGSDWSSKYRIIHPGGEVRWLAGAGRVFRDDAGAPQRMLGVNYDITARKQTEAALRDSRAKLAAALASMTDAVSISDVDGRLVEFNHAFATFHRFGSKEECKPTLAEYPALIEMYLTDGTPAPIEMWAVPRALRGETATNAEYTLRRTDSGETWIGSYSFGPIRDKDGVTVGAVVTSRDITERKRATEETARANALAELNRQKDEFIAMLGHELRNPLTPIRNAVTMLKRGAVDPKSQEASALIERQIVHMTRLIDDLLDVSRIERGKITLHVTEFDLCRLVRDTAEDHRVLFGETGVKLECKLPASPLWAKGDATRISQIVSNLLVNANKFTDRGGRVSIALLQEDARSAKISVRDTGIGMDQEMLQTLFRPFAQADRSMARSRGGLGLGLSLVKNLVELHGGSAQGSSPGLGQGSEFAVTLPILIPQPVETSAPEPSPAPAPRSRRILIVEDHLSAARSLKALLEDSGHEVALAHSGEEGQEQARAHKPDVLLCDIGLPGKMSGYDLARALRTDPDLSTTRLIAMTGFGQQQDLKRARDAGFDVHLTKPIDVDELEKLIERLCSGA